MLHSKYHMLDVNASGPENSGINLLASASTYGLVIFASPTSPSFQGTLYLLLSKWFDYEHSFNLSLFWYIFQWLN